MRTWLITLTILTGSGAVAAGQSASLDYTQWRGANRDGAAASFAEPKSWPDKLTLKWKVDVGAGYATPLIVGNRVYTHTRRGENEVMMALDAATGKSMWETSYAAPYNMNPSTSPHGQGPKSTPLFSNGKLFTLGISGIVSAFDAASGKLLWQKGSPAVDPIFGTAMSPIADNGLVIVHVGGNNHGALTAFDATTGEVKWSWKGDGPGYGSPIVVTLAGTRQIVSATQENIVGLSAATGELLWSRPFKTQYVNSAITPILYGDTIIVSGQDKGVSAFKPVKRGNQWTTDTVWDNQDVALFMSNGVLVGDTFYGMSHKNSGQLFALNAKTGTVLWKDKPREGDNAAFVKAGDLLFVLKNDGQLVVARSSQTGFEPLHRYTVADSETWAQPTISGNRVFVKDVSKLTLWTLN